ncbi:twin-arginine translocation signal domain-containing protein [Halogranum rubrum]|uniref:Uncharacterized protein n=1 Tax=Halogranum salarium B-1 TaxID=1210908 RepID=J3EWA9_9EURY|nr:twin-arginine translocation signal domain-containing protein [Halogranum salarium]EJN59122.1 hypothetical protein HSB1_25430 [Halogranum salarium B-1]
MALHSRRDVLRLGSAAAATSLAGCASLPFVSRPKLTLTFINHAPERVRFDVELLRENRREESEAHTFSQSYAIDARDEEGAGVGHDFEVVPSRRYLARVEVSDESGRTIDETHYHFYPEGADDEKAQEELVTELFPNVTTEATEYYLSFHRN